MGTLDILSPLIAIPGPANAPAVYIYSSCRVLAPNWGRGNPPVMARKQLLGAPGIWSLWPPEPWYNISHVEVRHPLEARRTVFLPRSRELQSATPPHGAPNKTAIEHPQYKPRAAIRAGLGDGIYKSLAKAAWTNDLSKSSLGNRKYGWRRRQEALLQRRQ